MPERNFENIELPAFYFDRLNTFFGLMESIIYNFNLKQLRILQTFKCEKKKRLATMSLMNFLEKKY